MRRARFGLVLFATTSLGLGCAAVLGLDELPPLAVAGDGAIDSESDTLEAETVDTNVTEDSDACKGVVCNEPPAAACVDGFSLRSYPTMGTCSGGKCTYSPSESTCPGGAACTSGVCGAPTPSCALPGDGRDNCGITINESCCKSMPVTGITTVSFSRSYDGVSSGYTDPQYKAQVSDFRLDRFEITVGRFRKFVDAVVGGWTPPAGSGKHTHLNGGKGLAASGAGGFEAGWDTAWNTYLPNLKATWDSAPYLGCDSTFSTWTPSAGSNERRPINCINSFQAEAFCIWDGGFLPSEAEWNYAASGGTEHRVYPWSSPATSTTIDETFASYRVDSTRMCFGDGLNGCTIGDLIFVGTKPKGNGKYGQADLAGNVWEWTLDWYQTPYAETSCVNCSYLSAAANRVIRGGSFDYDAAHQLAGYRYPPVPTLVSSNVGARCARTP